jgi:competence protein ComEC
LDVLIKYLFFASMLWVSWWVVSDAWKLLDTRLVVVFCDVGQGDMILIKKGSQQIVVDWGPSVAKANECLGKHLAFFDRDLELVINSHPQKDHLYGMTGVLDKYRVGTFAYSGQRGGDEYDNLWKKLSVQGTRMLVVAKGSELKVGEMDLKFIWPPSDLGSVSDINLLSVVLLFNYKSFDLFLPGDIEDEKELAMYESGLLRKVEVVKVPHHGSKTSSNEKMLEVLQPSLAVISAGKNNHYGHPHDLFVSRYNLIRSRLLRTDQNGEVRVFTDGYKWQFQTEQ